MECTQNLEVVPEKGKGDDAAQAISQSAAHTHTHKQTHTCCAHTYYVQLFPLPPALCTRREGACGEVAAAHECATLAWPSRSRESRCG